MQDTEAATAETTTGDDEQPEGEAGSPAAERSETRYPLAFDSNGNPLQVPPQAVAWRVRRGGGKRGRPRNVFDASTGRQLEIALGASIEDLAETNVPADRYLLYPVDGQGCVIPGVVAVTEVPHSDDSGDNDSGEDTAGILPAPGRDPILAMVDAMKGQQDVIKVQSAELSRAIGQLVSGYGTIRPVAPPPPPPLPMAPHVTEVVAPPPPAGVAALLDSILNIKPEQAMQFVMMAKQAYEIFKGVTAGAATGGP